MATFTIAIANLAGQTGLTATVHEITGSAVNSTPVALTESPAGEFTGTIPQNLDGIYYKIVVHNASGEVAYERVYRAAALLPRHDSEHMPDGSVGQVLIHNGTEFAATNFEALSNETADDVQGYYGLLTNFYFTGSVATLTEIETDDVDQWLDINFDTDALGKFNNRPDSMKLANIIGHEGTGTVADPIVFLLEGLTTAASCNFRASLTFEPDVDEAQLETRLIFDRHSGTTPSDQFPIADVSLNMTQGADVEYDAEPMLSFFVGDTIDTNGVGDAGKCRFQVRSSVEGTLRMRALTWYIQS